MPWLTDTAWLNAIQLSNENAIFKQLPEELMRNDAAWRSWYAENEPEARDIPMYETRFTADKASIGQFSRMLLVRALREDRTILCVNDFIRGMETLDVGGFKLPALGPKYVQPINETIEMIFPNMSPPVPVIYLLSAGADPTDSVETLARKKKKVVTCVSMGEGQEPVALRAINNATVNGDWVLLQNCHLGLPFMDGLEDLLAKIKLEGSGCLPDFRLFITTEPHPKFPIGLLQLAIKVTNEPPSGLRAGLMRSYTVIIDQDRMERIETAQWRSLVYALCFLHSIVQERRKYGSMGWCIPYEFNDGDLNACLTFLERHLFHGQLSWPTLQYMVSEVQYGGKITDDLDRRLFKTYGETWLTLATTKPGFKFNPEQTLQKLPDDFVYSVPAGDTFDDFAAFTRTFPEVDSPEVFGLHPNADLTFRNKEVQNLLNTILETQPKSGNVGGGRTREDVVYEKCEETLSQMPADYVEEDYMRSLDLSQPLDVFLAQEVQRFQLVLDKVRAELGTMLGAIRGEVVITKQIIDAINSVYDARVPHFWTYNPAGDEISWLAPTIGLWVSGLAARDKQLRDWLGAKGRPKTYWFPGWFNPAGFLTAVQQEVTRAHAADKWALDGVALNSEVTEYDRVEQVRNPPPEGVYISGLFLDGATWDKSVNSLAESAPKVLFCDMPILFVTAVTKSQRKGADLGPFGGFVCPVYKYVKRTDKYIIFSVTLACQQKPEHWILRGVALLCFTN